VDIKQVAKKVYRSVPFKHPTFRICRKFLPVSERVYKHLSFEGVITIPVDTGHRFRMHHYGFELENSIFWEGLENGWERQSIGIWKQLVKRSTTIFDIGANTGVYSLIAACLNPDSRVFALEPIERVFQRMVRNVELNKYKIHCLPMAASNFDGRATVYDTPTDHIYSVTVNKNLNNPGTAIVPTEISTVRLDSIIEDNKIQHIDLMKIDVETHEPEVLQGMGQYLMKFCPTILIEVLNDEIGKRIEQLVKDNGYLYFNIDERSNKVTKMKSITKSAYYNYLLCSEGIAQELGIL